MIVIFSASHVYVLFAVFQEHFNKLMDLTEQARDAYMDMVAMVEKDLEELNLQTTTSSLPTLFSHMGHSRTPSGCSAISFNSSILSEPISENYPHSEPETDSKGYEIVRNVDSKGYEVARSLDPKLMEESRKPPLSPLVNNNVAIPSGEPEEIMDNVDYRQDAEIDDGNEADTEDFNDFTLKLGADESPEGSVRYVGDPSDEDGDEEDNLDAGEEDIAVDTVDALPHIDSIHHMNYDLSAEILSQHSVRTADTSEALSTHSSRTCGDGGGSTIMIDPVNNDRVKIEVAKSPEGSGAAQRMRLLDKERIQTWVEETQNFGGFEEVTLSGDAGKNKDTNHNCKLLPQTSLEKT